MALLPWVVATLASMAVAIYFLIQTVNERQRCSALSEMLDAVQDDRSRERNQRAKEREADLVSSRRMADIHVFAKGLLDNLMALEIATRSEADYGGSDEEVQHGD